MAPPPRFGRGGRGGLVGLYALHLMSEGPIYGWQVAERIRAATHGGWRPGAGAIYPILKSLVERGLARVDIRNGRKIYTIAPPGRVRLREMRRWIGSGAGRWVNLRHLVLEMIPAPEREAWVLLQWRGQLEGFLTLVRDEGAFPAPGARRRLAGHGARSARRLALQLDRLRRPPARRRRER